MSLRSRCLNRVTLSAWISRSWRLSSLHPGGACWWVNIFLTRGVRGSLGYVYVTSLSSSDNLQAVCCSPEIIFCTQSPYLSRCWMACSREAGVHSSVSTPCVFRLTLGWPMAKKLGWSMRTSVNWQQLSRAPFAVYFQTYGTYEGWGQLIQFFFQLVISCT